MTKASSIRITKELQNILKTPSEYYTIIPDEGNMLVWNCVILGPKNTPYEDGTFHGQITFPVNYPFASPSFKFLTKIYHMNVSVNGEPCLKSLTDNWSVSTTVKTLFEHILSLMSTPNPNDPLLPELAFLYISNNERYVEVAKSWTETYASSQNK